MASQRSNSSDSRRKRRPAPTKQKASPSSRRSSMREDTVRTKKGFSLPCFSFKGLKRPTLPFGGSKRPRMRAQAITFRKILIASASIAAVIIVSALVLFVLSYTPVFTIKSIDAQKTEHLSSEEIGKIANIAQGTTLLNLDTSKIEANIKRNPWVESVSITRKFPDKISITVTERKIKAIVLLGAENTAWYMSQDGAWVEPAKIEVQKDQAVRDAAFKFAQSMKCYLIYGVAGTVEPVAGEPVKVSSIDAVLKYLKELTPKFAAQIVSFSAQTKESLSCTLSSGVEISLGNAEDISAKQRVIEAILEKHKNQITYINVRTPSNPTYRKVGSEQVKEGTGVSGSSTQESKESNDS